MTQIGNLYGLGKRPKGAIMNRFGNLGKDLLKTFLGETTKAGGTVIDKPITASKRIAVMFLYALLVIANKKYDLGLSGDALMYLAGLVATYVSFKSIEDAWKRSAAIAKHAASSVEPVKPDEKVPGLDRGA